MESQLMVAWSGWMMLAAAGLLIALILGTILLVLRGSCKTAPQQGAGEALDGLSRTLERMERRLDKIESSVKEPQD